MFPDLADFENYFGPLRLFRYLSVRCALACACAFITGILVAPHIIELMRRLKFGQSFRSAEQVGALAALHESKKGTPVMGGLIIFVGVMVSTLLFAKLNVLVLTAMLVYVSMTALGAADDLLKIKQKSSAGVSAKAKLFVQLLTVIAALAILYTSDTYADSMRELWVPFLKTPIIEYMPLWFAFPFLFLVIAGSSNAINLTDGVDGLAIGCTISVALVYAVFAYVTGNAIACEYLFIHMVPECGELAVVWFALVGASMAVLWFNANPADIFMGDTGSLALGGLIGAIAFMTHQPFTLVIVGGVFVMEAMSVILQVASYKTTKKRIFRMSPIHHHFEMKGWKENRLVVRFWIMSLIFALAGLATLKLR